LKNQQNSAYLALIRNSGIRDGSPEFFLLTEKKVIGINLNNH